MKKYLRLARKLMVASTESERRKLLLSSRALLDDRLILALREQCYAEWSSRPENVRRAAKAMHSLKKYVDSEFAVPACLWVEAISDITGGSFSKADKKLARAARLLQSLGHDLEAAQVQVARLFALAMLGRYAEAYDTGKKAIRTFLKHFDTVAAGKAELNLSNILARQGKHKEALKYCVSAGRRFLSADSPYWYVMAENCLANTYADINELDKAQHYYERALETAQAEGMEVTIAEIEACIGGVALNRGQYSKALRFLETSRQRYESINMPHQSAIADLEIAGIYVALNLLSPAREILVKLGDRFRRLRMRSEEARSRLLNGRLLAAAKELTDAKRELLSARLLFSRESNVSGQLSAQVAIASVELAAGNTKKAGAVLREVEPLLAASEDPRQSILFHETEGYFLLQLGDLKTSEQKLLSALRETRKLRQVDSERSILTLLSSLSIRLQKIVKAKRFLMRAIALTEKLHTNVIVDEFGIAFLGSRAAHYQELTKLLIQQRKVTRSFQILERGRSRSLLMSMARRRKVLKGPARLVTKTAELRTELNRHYKTLEHLSSDEFNAANTKIRYVEKKLSENERILASLKTGLGRADPKLTEIDVGKLRTEMRHGRALIEFLEIDGNFSAYIICEGRIKFLPSITTTKAVGKLLENLHFHFSTHRYGDLGRFTSQIRYRIDLVLKSLYDEIIKPIDSELRASSLVVVPAGNLHYVPFAALFDGAQYLVERFEIGSAPSAAIWQRLNLNYKKSRANVLIMGVADEMIPMAEQEARWIAASFPSAKKFVGAEASFDNFKRHAAAADVIHLACHGQFRPDNPMFSSLRLSDGWITVGDLTSLNLKAELVTLSACETGLSEIYPGDELLGMVRGFIAAGAATVVVSRWNLNDAVALDMMGEFYSEFQSGKTVSAALRSVQRAAVQKGIDPYRWAPLFSMGR